MVSVDVKHHVYVLFPQCTTQYESRRGQEEGGKLDSHEVASPEEIKSGEVVLGWRVGLPLLQLFSQRRSYGHCLCDSVLHSSKLGQQLRGAVVAAQCRTDAALINILLFWRRSTAALVFRVGACFEVSVFCPLFPTRPRP